MLIRRLNNLTLGKRLFPILFFEAYLGVTVWLFAYGPWPYQVLDGTRLYTFLGLAQLALFLGYLTAAFGKPYAYAGRWRVPRILAFSLCVQLILLLPTSQYRTGEAIPDFQQGLANPGSAYSASLQVRSDATPLVEYARMLVAPLSALFLPLLGFYWQRLRLRILIVSILTIFFILAMYVAMGTNKMIADVVLLSPWLLLAGHWAGISPLSRWHKLLLTAGSISAFAVFMAFYSQTMATRSGSFVKHGYFKFTDSWVDEDHFLLQHAPDSAQTALKGLSLYVAHGYYGLYLSLNEPFVPTYGVGHSMFLSRQMARVTGDPSWISDTYPGRIEAYGWNPNLIWHSIYPWLASDCSFFGTLIVVFLLGHLFAKSWVDVLGGSNPFAVAILAQFIVMLYYFSANNQCLADGEGVVAFWSLLIMWLYTRRPSHHPSKLTA